MESINVERQDTGHLKVDNNFQTTEPEIYALGDIIGGMDLTAVALTEGMALARYLYDDQPINMDYDNIATAIFCQPNIATVCLPESESRERYDGIEVYCSTFRAMKNTTRGSPKKTLNKLLVGNTSDRVENHKHKTVWLFNQVFHLPTSI